VVAGCGGDGDAGSAPTSASARTSTTAVARPAAVCAAAPVKRGAPPTWAAGLSGVPEETPFAVAPGGRLVAFLFVAPLRSRFSAGGANKILFVVRPAARGDDDDPMRIAARHRGRGSVASFRGAPGDERDGIYRTRLKLPRAGCWRLDLTWPSGGARLDVAVT
jgi:hypothetical protein